MFWASSPPRRRWRRLHVVRLFSPRPRPRPVVVVVGGNGVEEATQRDRVRGHGEVARPRDAAERQLGGYKLFIFVVTVVITQVM